MARFNVSGSFALTATIAKTIIRVMPPGTRAIMLRGFRIVDGLAAAADEGLLARVLTAGIDGTGTAATPFPLNNAGACLSTAKVNYTVEPTGSPVERYRTKVPGGGAIEKLFEGEEGIVIAHSSAVALELTSVSTKGSNVVSVELTFEEI